MRPSSLFIFLSQEDSVGSFGCNSAGVNQEDQSSGGNANVRWRDEGNKIPVDKRISWCSELEAPPLVENL